MRRESHDNSFQWFLPGLLIGVNNEPNLHYHPEEADNSWISGCYTPEPKH
jgi:hypothetical protein